MIRTLLKTYAPDSEAYEDFIFNNHSIPLIFMGMNGVYVVLEEKSDKKLLPELKNYLKLRDKQFFGFIIPNLSDDYDDNYIPIMDGIYYDGVHGFVDSTDIIGAFCNSYENHLLPQVIQFSVGIKDTLDYIKNIEYPEEYKDFNEEDELYIEPVLSTKDIETVALKMEEMSYLPDHSGKYRYNSDGSIEVKKYVAEKVGFIETMSAEREVYYPCMDMDGDDFFKLTLFGGMIGLHQYKTGHYIKGLLYTLTLGCCGVFWILDLIMILTGNYKYTYVEKVDVSGANTLQRKIYFNRPLKNKKFALISIPIACIVAFLIIYFGYIPFLQWITEVFAETVGNSETTKDILSKFGIIDKNALEEFENSQQSIELLK